MKNVMIILSLGFILNGCKDVTSGAQGGKGDNGDRGIQGPPGVQGQQGHVGPQGPSGLITLVTTVQREISLPFVLKDGICDGNSCSQILVIKNPTPFNISYIKIKHTPRCYNACGHGVQTLTSIDDIYIDFSDSTQIFNITMLKYPYLQLNNEITLFATFHGELFYSLTIVGVYLETIRL